MKFLYLVAWGVIIGFLLWSGNLLVQIQSIGSTTANLHQLSLQLDSLAGSWRDLNRPGNDVLENYEVEKQRAALGFYMQRFDSIHDTVMGRVRGESPLESLISDLLPFRDNLVNLALEILELSAQRESLRQGQAAAEAISEKETAAAAAMARMDQTFQDGLDLILEASSVVVKHERGLEGQQRDNFQRLYIMLLVTLVASALSLQLIRHVMRQREALRDAAARINTIMNNVVDGIVTVDVDGVIQSMNQSSEHNFGYREVEVLGRKFVMLLEESSPET